MHVKFFLRFGDQGAIGDLREWNDFFHFIQRAWWHHRWPREAPRWSCFHRNARVSAANTLVLLERFARVQCEKIPLSELK